MTVVLEGRELVGRRERAINRSEIQLSPIRRRIPANILWNIGEGNERFALRERGENPLGDVQRAESGQRRARFEGRAPGVLDHEFPSGLKPCYRAVAGALLDTGTP